jgi:hypothetical protein
VPNVLRIKLIVAQPLPANLANLPYECSQAAMFRAQGIDVLR